MTRPPAPCRSMAGCRDCSGALFKRQRSSIRETELPPKPVLSVDMAEYERMQELMEKARDEARAITRLRDIEKPKLEKQLSELNGLFKGKERKALTEKIARMQREIDDRLDRIPGILKDDGYPDVQAFKRIYDKATALAEQYNRNLAAWEWQIYSKKMPKREKLPEKESIQKKLRNTMQRQRAKTTSLIGSPNIAAMTWNAKTKENTAGSPCGAYIKI